MRLTAAVPETFRCLKVLRNPKATSQSSADHVEWSVESLNNNVVTYGVAPRPLERTDCIVQDVEVKG